MINLPDIHINFLEKEAYKSLFRRISSGKYFSYKAEENSFGSYDIKISLSIRGDQDLNEIDPEIIKDAYKKLIDIIFEE